MRVLGIDPGFARLGIAVVEGSASKPLLLWSDCVEPKPSEPHERLATISKAIVEVIAQYKPQVLAIETLFFSTNRKTALAVAQARGAILAAAGDAHLALREFSPQHVKLAVTGYGAADKSSVARMIPKLIALKSKKRLDDELDAIAVAIAGLTG